MNDLRRRITNIVGFGVLGKNTYGEIGDAIVEEIAKTHLLLSRDDAMHVYNVLMTTGKTAAARLMLDHTAFAEPIGDATNDPGSASCTRIPSHGV